MQRILITGGNSFSARHAVTILRAQAGVIIGGFGRRGGDVSQVDEWFTGDIRNRDEIRQAVHQFCPEAVLHLAACSDPFDVGLVVQTNVTGTWNLLAACEESARPCSVLLVGSAASFGEMQPGEHALSGHRVPRPREIYGCSRQWQLELARLFAGSEQLRIVQCRTFNLIGPGLPEKYAAAAIAKRILQLPRGSRQQFPMRDPGVVRDLVDVRDAVRAWLAILRTGKPDFPYSIGRGIGVTIAQLALEIADIHGVELILQELPALSTGTRSRIVCSVADQTTLTADTGWQPQISVRRSLTDMVEQLYPCRTGAT